MQKRWMLGVQFMLGVFLASQAAAMTSTNFGINWDSVNSGGDDISSSTNFFLRDTVGEQATGFSSSTNYTVSAGYRVGDEAFTGLSFAIGTQENATRTAYSSFSSSSLTVVVSSVANFSVGDLIGVVENGGLSENIAIGHIESIGGTTITVDSWDGSPASISPTPSGGDDFVYRLNGSSAALGTLSSSLGSTSLTATRVASDAANGYTVYVNDDGNLRTGTAFIQNVADGSVTVGSEEYGWRVFGSTATSTSMDSPFATSTQSVQQSATPTAQDRVGLVYKASITPSTPAGNYAHLVFFTLTANF